MSDQPTITVQADLDKIHPSNTLPIALRLAHWNAAGFWCSVKTDREAKLAIAADLLANHDILFIDEAHVEPITYDAAESWAGNKGYRLYRTA